MNPSTLINAIACKSPTGTKTTRAFIAAPAIASTLSECAVFPYSSNPPVDQQITADVDAKFEQHAELQAPYLLRVQTISRIAYLNGTVSTGLRHDGAESVANEVHGVAKVVHSIAIDR
jgi:hypothetical protein